MSNITLTIISSIAIAVLLFIALIVVKKKITKDVDYAFDTNHQIKRVCRTIGSYAKKQRLIQDNYFSADYIDFSNRPKHQIHTLTDEEGVKLYNYLLSMPEIKISTSLILTLITGLRRGEISGLQWDDLDFEKKETNYKTNSNYC